MILFALHIAIAGTLAALAGLMVDRLCPRHVVALRHSALFACMVVIGASPLLAGFARMHGIGVLPVLSNPTAVAIVDDRPANVGESLAAQSTGAVLAPVHAGISLSHPAFAARQIASLLPYGIGIVLAVWALGCVYQSTRLVRSWLLLRQLSIAAKPVGADIRRLVRRATRQLGLPHSPEVSWCAPAPSPMVIGLHAPRVLLPRSAASLSVDELEAVLLHELAHIARHDQWAGLIASVLAIGFWWCWPVAILLRRLGDLREELCDAHVVGQQGDGLTLATALLAVCEGAVRGRHLYTAAPLGAAGRSGGALRNRIQSLTKKENHPMIRTTLSQRFAIVALGLLIAVAATVVNVRSVDASAPVMLTGLTPGLRLVSAPDFWTTTGATTKHDFQPMMVSDLQKIVRDGDHAELALRAAKLLCDNEGHSRANASLSEADNVKAVKVAFEHLESHLADAEIAKFAPARGFSHMTVSMMGNDEKDVAWVLIETVALPPAFNGGLNIRVDLKASKVTGVKQWGDVRPAPVKK